MPGRFARISTTIGFIALLIIAPILAVIGLNALTARGPWSAAIIIGLAVAGHMILRLVSRGLRGAAAAA